MRPYLIRVDPNPMTDGLIIRRKDTQRQSDCHIKAEAEFRVMFL